MAAARTIPWPPRSEARKAGVLAYRLFCTPPATRRPLKPGELCSLQGAEASFVPGARGALRLYRWPARRNGPGEKETRTVLLVHGWGGRALSMRPFVEPLLERGFTVAVGDAAAHGESEGERSTLPDFAGDILAMAGRLGALHGVVAHSFGGMASAYAADDESPLSGKLALKRLAMLSAPDRLEDIVLRFGCATGAPDYALDGLRRRIEESTRRPVGEISTGASLHRAGVEALVIHDRDDEEVPFAEGEAVVARAPQARWSPTRGLGHRRILHAPAVVEEITGFLAR